MSIQIGHRMAHLRLEDAEATTEQACHWRAGWGEGLASVKSPGISVYLYTHVYLCIYIFINDNKNNNSSNNIYIYTNAYLHYYIALHLIYITHQYILSHTLNTTIRTCKKNIYIYVCKYIYIYIHMVPSSISPSPPDGLGPQVASPSLLFASYWQHFLGPASYLLGLCSISDYQPCIY